MKLPDNEPLEAEDYWTVTDTWKQEWERGVQVKLICWEINKYFKDS